MPGVAEQPSRPGRRPRDRSLFEEIAWVAPAGRCAHCGRNLWISQHRERPFQSLEGRWWVTLKDRRCPDPECPGRATIYRPLEESSFCRVRGCSFGLDVLERIGQRRQGDARSFPEIHQELKKDGVLISSRHVPNLFRLYLALLRCRSLEDETVRRRLREQGRAILMADALWTDDVSPRLYVVRERLSGEFLLVTRIESATEEALVEFLSPLRDLEVPVEGVVVDKEGPLVGAFQKVLPRAPLQLCQMHYLKNLVRPMETELAELTKGVREAVGKVREVAKALDSPSVSSEEREYAEVLCRGVEAMGKSRAGDKLFEPPALKRFGRLRETAEEVRQAVERKGGRWPLLSRILMALSVLTNYTELARRLERQFQVVRDIANILGLAGPGEEIAGLLQAFLIDLFDTAPRRGRGAAFGHFIDHVVGVSERFWFGLFRCYDILDLPRTNNDLEQFFNVLKRHARRVHGRKSTAGGPLESLAPFLLLVWNRIEEHPKLEKLLEELPPEKLRQAREELEKHCQPARRRRSFLRAPRKHLERARKRFLGTD